MNPRILHRFCYYLLKCIGAILLIVHTNNSYLLILLSFSLEVSIYKFFFYSLIIMRDPLLSKFYNKYKEINVCLQTKQLYDFDRANNCSLQNYIFGS